ncbi:MAG TPA: sigma-E factor negative regulatory protein [Luteimonas sp.]|nr:sigma-E factor negative regulatory protein [Luteimonas sp.]
MTENERNGIDRMEIHYRQQLCALIDGDLSPDEARFLLRRLQHDAELGGCWERWQMIGETLRGRAVAPLPGDFSQRVAAAIAAEPAVARSSAASGGGALAVPGSRWARWGGGALAASVALVALFMARQQTPSSVAPDSETPAPIVAAAPASVPPARAPEPVPSAPALPDPQPAATLAAATIAVAEVPRRAAANRRATTRSQSQRAALRAARENAETPIVVVAVNDAPASVSPAQPAATPGLVASKDPFSTQHAAPSRPWPSATLPQLSGSGAFNADYASSGAYYPFQPRVAPPSSPPPSGDALQEAPQR